jgi:hypothetical protein
LPNKVYTSIPPIRSARRIYRDVIQHLKKIIIRISTLILFAIFELRIELLLNLLWI